MTRPSSRLMRAISTSIAARNSSASAGEKLPGGDACEQPLGFAARQIRRRGGRMAVIGRRRARLARTPRDACDALRDSRATRARPRRQLAEALERRGECLVLGIDDGVGTIGGDRRGRFQPLLAMARCASSVSTGDSVVASTSMLKRSNKRARPERILRELLADDVEVVIGGVGLERAPSARRLSRTRSSATAQTACRETDESRSANRRHAARGSAVDGPRARSHAERRRDRRPGCTACDTGSDPAPAAARSRW